MKILALIAARGGSRRLPGKNIRLLGGRPLLAWSVDVVRGMPDICDILLSTDDPEIARVGAQSGALVPWLRPDNLASDTASSVDVCLHALDRYEVDNGEVDGLLLLQPTSPFRSRDSVSRGLELFRHDRSRPVVGVSPARSHPQWCFRLENNTLRPFNDGTGLEVRSQDLPAAYAVNGAFYLMNPVQLRRFKTFFSSDPAPLLMESPEEILDIDDEFDWKMAQCMIGCRQP